MAKSNAFGNASSTCNGECSSGHRCCYDIRLPLQTMAVDAIATLHHPPAFRSFRGERPVLVMGIVLCMLCSGGASLLFLGAFIEDAVEGTIMDVAKNGQMLLTGLFVLGGGLSVMLEKSSKPMLIHFL